MKKQQGSAWAWFLGFAVWVVAAWLTHIIVCLKVGNWGYLIAGALLFPVGIIHGTGLWFGLF